MDIKPNQPTHTHIYIYEYECVSSTCLFCFGRVDSELDEIIKSHIHLIFIIRKNTNLLFDFYWLIDTV